MTKPSGNFAICVRKYKCIYCYFIPSLMMPIGTVLRVPKLIYPVNIVILAPHSLFNVCTILKHSEITAF